MTDPALELLRLLGARGWTLATAESLTGGGVAQRLTAVPGASAAFRGGVVAYATEVKRDLLGVPADLLTDHGAVSSPCAQAMAAGVRRLLGSDVALATTGVAGPDPQEGKPPGRVHVAVALPTGAHAERLALTGDRAAVRAAAATAVLRLALRHLVSASGEQVPGS